MELERQFLKLMEMAHLYSPPPFFSIPISQRIHQDLTRLQSLYCNIPSNKDIREINLNGEDMKEICVDSFKLTHNTTETNVIFSAYNTNEKVYKELYSDAHGLNHDITEDFLSIELLSFEEYLEYLDGLQIIERDVYKDKRGYFSETHNKEVMDFLPEFKQDNISFSRLNVLRGLHYQETQPQGKLVSVIEGCVFDVALNIDPKHPEFGKWFGIKLEPGTSFYIPPFYAHGFYTLDETYFSYKCTEVFKPGDGKTILWNSCGIDWKIPKDYKELGPFLSDQDKNGTHFVNYTAERL
jgi:dTDP-4-dehydrorhamnose 3,5-epimerase